VRLSNTTVEDGGEMARGRHGRRAHRGWKIAIATALVASVLGAGTAYAAYRYDRSAADRILPGVSIEGVDVSDMSRSQALREVTAKAQETLGASLTVEAAGRSWIVTPAALGMSAGVEAAVDRAFALADRMGFVNRVYQRVAATDRVRDRSLVRVRRSEDQALWAGAQDAVPAVDPSLVGEV
jgi:hypothetical protein